MNSLVGSFSTPSNAPTTRATKFRLLAYCNSKKSLKSRFQIFFVSLWKKWPPPRKLSTAQLCNGCYRASRWNAPRKGHGAKTINYISQRHLTETRREMVISEVCRLGFDHCDDHLRCMIPIWVHMFLNVNELLPRSGGIRERPLADVMIGMWRP